MQRIRQLPGAATAIGLYGQHELVPERLPPKERSLMLSVLLLSLQLSLKRVDVPLLQSCQVG
jgi:hypothetical protein